ncbi:MAG: hypothetical protein ABEH81_03355 [Halopenitus sp.]
MSAATVSRWSRRYVLASAAFLVAWQVGVLSGASRATTVVLGLYGFVLHMVFGKAYALVPSYFDRSLPVPQSPAVQFPLVLLGTLGLVADAAAVGPSWTGAIGAVLWSLGVGVFVGTLAWTIRTNPTGGNTGTGDANARLRPTDRLANAVVPVALAYLLLGALVTLASRTMSSLPVAAGGSRVAHLLAAGGPEATHLIAAGTAALLIFGLGARLLPRFLVKTPPRWLVATVLSAGALGPALLAGTFRVEPWFRLGALVEATAVVAYAGLAGLLYARSDRRRVGFYGVLAGALAGVGGVALGLRFAFHGVSAATVQAHLRLNLLGFVGSTIVGLAYQFYPPGVGAWPGSGDRTAALSIAGLAGGAVAQAVGLVSGIATLTTVGELAALLGALSYAWVLASVFATR